MAHFAAALIGGVEGLGNVIVLLLGNHNTLALDAGIPVGLVIVQVHTDGEGLNLPAHLIEQVELELGQDQHGIGNAGILHILFCCQNDVSGILGQRTVLRIVDNHGVSGHGQGGNSAEGVHYSGVGIGDENHIGLFHHSVAVVGGIETNALSHHFLVKIGCGNGDMTELAVDIHHLKVYHPDALILNQVHNILYCFAHNAFAPFGFQFLFRLFQLYKKSYFKSIFLRNLLQKKRTGIIINETDTGGISMASILEVCADSYASAMAAISGGADRLELCSALAMGGLTPSPALLRQIREVSSIPVRCLMRPRGGDFLYTSEEIRQMATEIPMLRAEGADGFVIGCLNPDGHLDTDAMKPLLEASDGAGLTLHRCIDVSRDLCRTYRDAALLGIDTVLTSGGAGNCLAGMERIRKLNALREEIHGPEILIGAGVKASVISQFLQEIPGIRAFHMSGKTEIESGMRFRREGVPMGIPGMDEWHIHVTDKEALAAAKALLSE